MTRRTFIFLALLLLSLGFTASELGTRCARLRAAGRRERVQAEAAGQGEEAHGGRRASARRGGRPRHPAQGRQRDRCRHRRADGAQPGRAAILRDRRRRLHSLLGRGHKAARKHRRPRDRARRRHARALPRCATASRCRATPPWRAGFRSASPACWRRLPLAHDKYGKLPWAELFQPAIALARDGFPISPRLAKMLAETDPRSFAPAAHAYFFDAQGRPWPVGYKLKNPALADTLEMIARDGAKAFYQGDIANDIARAVQNDPRKPGKLAADGHRALSRQGARAGLRALSRPPGLRHGAVVLRRRHCGAGARPRRAIRSRPCTARRARHPCHRRG